MDKKCLAINPKSVAMAYAFFRSSCTRVAMMTGLVPRPDSTTRGSSDGRGMGPASSSTDEIFVEGQNGRP
ncbi:unnamed protein product [Nippostrongylus brasiliensis]|uniref:Uncharacterized protein n=1 Tax=Nippostrongylus brasiliensis TaxID=27835 RepID=A0A0N4YCX8_NIPBR|nr:unnamed protein product [Nippostrongylus brasiliensis]